MSAFYRVSVECVVTGFRFSLYNRAPDQDRASGAAARHRLVHLQEL
ncbi:MAG: hypothetical protein GY938_22495 [Ketobacter sp.]|nr:hypothetical protein [Ketobacter sp.]